MDEEQIIKIVYFNLDGKPSIKTILPKLIWYGHTEFYKKDQWLINAYDMDTREFYDFAMDDIEKWNI